jgi:MinD superfamily P-loop ATPase
MKKIAITGGKGGIGKSTVAVLLANKLFKENKKVVLVDCDVECPNDYLLLRQKLGKARAYVYAEFPLLDKTKCQKCGRCVSVCRSHAIFQAPQKYPVFLPELCSACGACWFICPYGAIKTKKVKIGRIYLNKVPAKGEAHPGRQSFQPKVQSFYLITGIANPALEETSPVVRKTKEFALNFAKKLRADYAIFDTAAGTHCLVIAALMNTDLAYAVTEPTPMGAYDLRLILDLLKKMKIKFEIILNQSNLVEKDRIEKLFKKMKIKKFDQTIPYSKELAQAYSQGKLLDFNNLLK